MSEMSIIPQCIYTCVHAYNNQEVNCNGYLQYTLGNIVYCSPFIFQVYLACMFVKILYNILFSDLFFLDFLDIMSLLKMRLMAQTA